MTPVTAALEPAPGARGGAPGALEPPETRGRTEIADRVLERIAARALTDVDAAGGSSRRVLGVSLGKDSAPRVTARVDGGLATLRMTISVVYPAPIREVTRDVRERVTRQVGRLTGLEVRQVDIEVDRLLPARDLERRVL
ncbi:Asp23/Gls24 family envelope stress response protein [Spirillospora sp. CA-294931]|uniref:Asp23/Gls24 family envelope stress response protein n=1 Tax=Spirillospora sp. CA-294931 TaxID=3240042 RepID=UPI003D8F7D29